MQVTQGIEPQKIQGRGSTVTVKPIVCNRKSTSRQRGLGTSGSSRQCLNELALTQGDKHFSELHRAGNPRHFPVSRPRNSALIAFLLLPSARLFDLFAFSEAFAEAGQLHEESWSYDMSALVINDAHLPQVGLGLHVGAERSYRDHKGEIDTLVLIGSDHSEDMRHDRNLYSWVRQISSSCRRVVAVGTGTFVLAEAGLLEGRRATTHWRLHRQLMLRYPKVSVQPETLFVRDGKFFTSAGGSACLDLALRLIEEDLGNSIASSVAGIMVLFAKRTGGQPQISATLCAQKEGGHVFGDLLAWMADNAHRELTITKLAKRAAMSPRNFSRTFVREIGTTPAKHIKALRVEAAQRELEAGTTNLTKVAEVSGFTSTETLRRAFLAEKGITPGKFLATMT